MSKLLRHVMPVVIAVGLGPLIAGLAVTIYAVGVNLSDNTGSLPLTDLLKMASFYLIFAYFLGGPIAFLAGLLVSIWMIWRQPNAIAVVSAAMIATCVYMGIGALGALGLAEMTNARSNFVFTLALAAVAAVGAWILTRRFVPAMYRSVRTERGGRSSSDEY